MPKPTTRPTSAGGRESVQATARQLAAEGLQVEPVLDTFRVHTVEVGQVTVRAGAAEEPAALRVELQQLEGGTPSASRPRCHFLTEDVPRMW